MGVPEVAMRGKRSRGCRVGWLIAVLLGLAFLSGLVVFIRRHRSRPSADDTLVADLLGPPELPGFSAPRTWEDGPRSPAVQAQKDGQPLDAARARKDRRLSRVPGRASPSGQAREEGQHSPTPGRSSPAPRQPSPAPGHPSPALQAREEGQPSPTPARSSPDAQAREVGQPSLAPSAPPAAAEDWLETQLAWINAWSQRMKEQITPTEQPESHSKE